MTEFEIIGMRKFNSKYEGKPPYFLLKTQALIGNAIAQHEGWCYEDLIALGIGNGDKIEYIAEKAEDYNGKPQIKYKSVKLIKKADEKEYSFGKDPITVPGKIVTPKNDLYNSTVQNNIENYSRIYPIPANESSDERMVRMALERDTWQERVCSALAKLTAAIDRNTAALDELMRGRH